MQNMRDTDRLITQTIDLSIPKQEPSAILMQKTEPVNSKEMQAND